MKPNRRNNHSQKLPWQKIVSHVQSGKQDWRTLENQTEILQELFADIQSRAVKHITQQDRKQPVRDQILNMFMLHLDELQPYKKFFIILVADKNSLPRLLRVLIQLAAEFSRDIATHDKMPACALPITCAGLYAYMIWIWLNDDSRGCENTIAKIDRALHNLDKAIEKLCSFKDIYAEKNNPQGRK